LFPFPLQADDIAITSIKITYLDDQTNSTKAVVRELNGFSDGDYWSKPHEVDIEIDVINKRTDIVKNIRFSGGLFVLLENEDDYPSIKDNKHLELKDVTDKPVWTWNRSYSFEPRIAQLQPEEFVKIVFRQINIWNELYPFGYSVSFYAPKKKRLEAMGVEKTLTPKITLSTLFIQTAIRTPAEPGVYLKPILREVRIRELL
jgi:hypothetical protein